jgi:hypothetical protein
MLGDEVVVPTDGQRQMSAFDDPAVCPAAPISRGGWPCP